MPERRYDLEERLLNYAAMIIQIVERLPKTRAGSHIGGQLIRSGTSPLANHAEAQAAESQKDFIHKLRLCLKELRESYRWLHLIERVALVQSQSDMKTALEEADELIRIFVKSIQTATKKTDDA